MINRLVDLAAVKVALEKLIEDRPYDPGKRAISEEAINYGNCAIKDCIAALDALPATAGGVDHDDDCAMGLGGPCSCHASDERGDKATATGWTRDALIAAIRKVVRDPDAVFAGKDPAVAITDLVLSRAPGGVEPRLATNREIVMLAEHRLNTCDDGLSPPLSHNTETYKIARDVLASVRAALGAEADRG